MNSFRHAICASIAVAIGMASPLQAQIDRADLKGTLTDGSGAVVPGATVTVLFPQTGFHRSVISTDAGDYVFPALPLGTCTLTVTARNFAATKLENIVLEVGDVRTANLQLGLEGVTQAVSVNASTVDLDRDSAATGGVIAQQQVENLPINGRNWAALQLLVPGAVNTGAGNELTIRFAGRGIDDNRVTFDGVDASGILRQAQKLDLRLQFSSDSIGEFRAQSTVYSAQFGGSTGGQVDVVSKTGTNHLHGSVYEFLRNDVLNARALFATSQLPLRLNQYGASVGGPIFRDHTFFFANYEGLRQVLGQPLVGFVPSAAYRAVTLAKTPALAPLLNYYPLGQTPTTSANVSQFAGSGRAIQNEDYGLIRLDQTFNAQTSAFVRFNVDQGRLVNPNGDTTGFIGDSLATQDDPKNGVVGLQHTFGPTLLNDVKFGINRTPYYAQNISLAPFQLAVAGFSTLHDTLQQTQASMAYSLVDTVNLAFGKQSITTGGGFRRVELNLNSTQETQYAATSAATLQADTLSGATFLAAIPNEDARKTEFDLFFQDQYKITPDVLLSLGLRYDNFGAFAGVNGRDLPFDPLTCPAGYCQAGIPFYRTDPGSVQPRFAVTWSPGTQHGDTVIRAGYGLYSGEAQLGDLISPLSNLGQRLALTPTPTAPLNYPLPPSLTSKALSSNAPKGLYRGRVNEQVSEFGVSVEQRFPFQVLSSIGYIGSHGAHLPEHTVLNVLNPVTRLAPLPAFNLIDYKLTGDNSNYSGLVTSLERQFSRGFSFGATYLWSHSTDDGANVGNNTGAETDFPQNVACRICERASSDQDIRSSFTANAVYDLPAGRGRAYFNHGLADHLLGGFQLSGIGVARTGLPVNVTVARTAASLPDGNNLSPQRPNRVPGVSLLPPQGRTPGLWINPAAYAVPANGTFGNAPRNEVRAPGTWQIDSSLQKALVTSDRMALNFRGDVFNLFNRAQYGSPAALYNTPSFGQITTQINAGPTGTATQRVIQVSLRLRY